MPVRRCAPGSMTPAARLEEAASLLLRGALRLLVAQGRAEVPGDVQDPQIRLDEAPLSERPCDPAADPAIHSKKEVA